MYKVKTIREWKSQIDEDVNEFMYEISMKDPHGYAQETNKISGK
jgi:hypothetical protein